MQLNTGISQKIIISGIQHSGKTYLADVIGQNYNAVVYTSNLDDKQNYWNKDNYIQISTPDIIGDFDYWCGMVIKWAKAKKINCLIIDDADMLFKTHFDTSPNLRDLWANHYHYGLTIILISHRLVDIPRRLYGQVELFCLFPIEDVTTKDVLNGIYLGLGDMVANLTFGDYHFIYKRIGEAPIEMVV